MAFRRLKEGDRTGEYVLERLVDRSDLEEMWIARHHLLPREVRILVAVAEGALTGMKAMGIAQHGLDHHAIVKTLGLNLDKNPPYLVLEHVPGRTLREVLAGESPLPWPRARSILRGLLEGLAHAHDKGIVHGDLRPENVLLDEKDLVHLTGFGARAPVQGQDDLLSDSLDADETQAVRDAAYTPRDPDPPSPAFDVYSAGTILFELVSGGLPAGAELPSDVVEGLPPEVDGIFRKAYTSINLRYPDASAILADLGGVSGRIETAPAEQGIRILKSVRKCPKCLAENRMEFVYCTVCGTQFDVSPPRCPTCAKPLIRGAKFCTFCGSRQNL